MIRNIHYMPIQFPADLFCISAEAPLMLSQYWVAVACVGATAMAAIYYQYGIYISTHQRQYLTNYSPLQTRTSIPTSF